MGRSWKSWKHVKQKKAAQKNLYCVDSIYFRSTKAGKLTQADSNLAQLSGVEIYSRGPREIFGGDENARNLVLCANQRKAKSTDPKQELQETNAP